MDALPEILLKVLEARGIAGEELVSFLNPTLRDLPAPSALPGIAAAADAILPAVRSRRPIVVFGDYDCDGVCATAIVVKTLKAFGADVTPFIPERLKEGYGMTEASVERMLAEHPDVSLVVTVDNGINAVDPVFHLHGHHVQVVVTDHHLPTVNGFGKMVLPTAVAIVDPKVSAPEGLRNLCGAGVAYLLAQELVVRAKSDGLYDGPSIAGPLLVLAGLATVTDIVPLVGANRILVAEALRRFAALAPVGLKELHFRAARSASPTMTSKDFGFLLGPRINAAGRIATGEAALELILEDNREFARTCAMNVDRINAERKTIEESMSKAALEQAKEQLASRPAALVIDIPDGHQGVAGIVAARVMEQCDRSIPVCVVVGGHGSARAPEGFNVRDALDAASKSADGRVRLLDRFGGHAQAAGFSVAEGRIDDFRRRFDEVSAKMAGDAGGGTDAPGDAWERRVEAWLAPADLTLELAEALTRLEPYGEGNREPVFGLKGVFLRDVRTLGSDGRHLSLSVNGVKALWWGHGELVESLRLGAATPKDLIFNVALSDYGSRHVELRLLGIR